MSGIKLTVEEKQMILEMYKAHYSVKEVQSVFQSHSYGTFSMMFRGYTNAGIEKYDRMQLIENELDNQEGRVYERACSV